MIVLIKLLWLNSGRMYLCNQHLMNSIYYHGQYLSLC